MLGEKDVQAWSDSDFLNAIATLLLEKGLADKLMLGIMAGEPGVKYIEWNNFGQFARQKKYFLCN